MNNLKKWALAIAVMATPIAASAQAGGDDDFRTYTFIQAQGGLQLPFTPGSRTDLLQPNFGVNLGHWFAPVVGARLSAEGFKSKVQWDNKFESFDYMGFNLDALFSISRLINKGSNPALNVYALGGFGLNYLKDKDFYTSSTKSDFAHNLRVGVGLEYRLARPLSLSLEYRVNNTADYFNGRKNNTDDWFSSLLVGVAYNFGYSKHAWSENNTVVAVPPQQVKPQTLYEQMQAGVNERMNTWMKRLKGESKADYLARTTDAAIQTQRLDYTKAISTDMAGNRVNTSLKDLQYSKAAGLLGVQFTDMPSITLRVPESEISSIKGTSDLQFTNTVYNLNPGDKFEVLYTEAINPATGKKYTYVSTKDAQFVQSDGYMPLTALHQDMVNKQRLQAIATNAVQEARDKNILSDNTTITVSTEVMPTQNGKTDYRVSYKYTVKDAFSVQDDFAPGKYDADQSAASTAMLKIINQSLAGDFAQYVKAGKGVDIRYTGSADAKPINGKIAYSGKYGDIKNQPVNINGKQEKLTVTKASGITSNEQLSLVRAISVRNYLLKNVKGLKDMQTSESFNVEVSPNEGSQFRRVAVDFIFRDAFNK
ncbi:MAG: porin family protein [Bacteroidaceae bacterium]|nr:porin family protein [Bacteroidaceae bacterium]